METPKNKLLTHCQGNHLKAIRDVGADALRLREIAEEMISSGVAPDKTHEHCLKSLVDTCVEFMRRGLEAAEALAADFETKGEGLGTQRIGECRKLIREAVHAAMLMDAGSHALSDMEVESGRTISLPTTP